MLVLVLLLLQPPLMVVGSNGVYQHIDISGVAAAGGKAFGRWLAVLRVLAGRAFGLCDAVL